MRLPDRRRPQGALRKACAAGATIVDDYTEKNYGGAGYSCRDPAGHLWYFGSYDPWQPAAG